MKLNKSSQLALAVPVSLLAATLVTACSQLTQTLTVDFVYVTSAVAAGSNNYGEIDVYEINSESGRMRPITTSPFPSQGRNPVAEAVSSDYGSLFVVNEDDNTIVQFIIGSDGKLYPYNTVNTPGIFPMAITTNKSFVFVVDLYEPLPICSSAEPCPGSISVIPLTAASGSTPVAMGTAVTNSAISGQYWPLTLSGSSASHVVVPTSVNVLASGSYVYVTAYDSTVSPHVGYVFAYAVGSDGTLTAVSGSPFSAGVRPSGISSDASSAYVYVTDFTSGNVRSYKVGSSGGLTAVSGSPFKAGGEPSAIVVNPTYPFAYVTNYLDSTVTAYSISNGVLTSVGSYSVGLEPVAIGVDPSTNRFLYTANFLGNTVSGFELSTTAGTLLESQFSPFASNNNPTAVAAVPHNGTGAGITK